MDTLKGHSDFLESVRALSWNGFGELGGFLHGRFFSSDFLINLRVMQDLAEQLVDLFTATRMSKVFFCNSGSEGNDTQVRCLSLDAVISILVDSGSHESSIFYQRHP